MKKIDCCLKFFYLYFEYLKSITHFIIFFRDNNGFTKKKCLYILPVNAITVPIGNNSSTLISTFGLIKSQNWNSIGHVIGGNSLTKDLLALIFQGWRCNNNSFIRKPNYIGGGQKKNLNSDFTKFLSSYFFFVKLHNFLPIPVPEA